MIEVYAEKGDPQSIICKTNSLQDQAATYHSLDLKQQFLIIQKNKNKKRQI